MSKVKDLIPKLPEIYQPISVNGEVLADGNRDCQKRWDIIKSHIKPNDVILELGSATGFFTQRIAKEYPDSLVISIESDPIMCEIQRETFKAEGIYNVVVCQHRITPEDLVKWSRHAEVFDVVLTMAVLHHFPSGAVEAVFEAFKDLGKVIINEVPSLEEVEACGQDTIKEVHKVLPEGQWLGSTTSHLGHERDIVMYPGNKEHRNLDAFFGVSHPDRHKFKIKNGKINGKHIIPGVNYHNLKSFNIMYPLPKWFEIQSRAAYECLEFKSDVKAWNLLMTSRGMKAIDFTDVFSEDDPASFHEGDIEKLVE